MILPISHTPVTRRPRVWQIEHDSANWVGKKLQQQTDEHVSLICNFSVCLLFWGGLPCVEASKTKIFSVFSFVSGTERHELMSWRSFHSIFKFFARIVKSKRNNLVVSCYLDAFHSVTTNDPYPMRTWCILRFHDVNSSRHYFKYIYSICWRFMGILAGQANQCWIFDLLMLSLHRCL